MSKPEISPEHLELAHRIMEIMEGKERSIERMGIYHLAEGLIQYHAMMLMLAQEIIDTTKVHGKIQ